VNLTIGGLAVTLCFQDGVVSHVVFPVRLWWPTHDVVVGGMSFVIKFWTGRAYGFGDIAIFRFGNLA